MYEKQDKNRSPETTEEYHTQIALLDGRDDKRKFSVCRKKRIIIF